MYTNQDVATGENVGITLNTCTIANTQAFVSARILYKKMFVFIVTALVIVKRRSGDRLVACLAPNVNIVEIPGKHIYQV